MDVLYVKVDISLFQPLSYLKHSYSTRHNTHTHAHLNVFQSPTSFMSASASDTTRDQWFNELDEWDQDKSMTRTKCPSCYQRNWLLPLWFGTDSVRLDKICAWIIHYWNIWLACQHSCVVYQHVHLFVKSISFVIKLFLRTQLSSISLTQAQIQNIYCCVLICNWVPETLSLTVQDLMCPCCYKFSRIY